MLRTLDSSVLDADWQRQQLHGEAVSKPEEMTMEIYEIQQAIINHSTLQCAGYSDPKEYSKAVNDRILQLAGMLELARRVPVDAELITFLEIHRDNLVTAIKLQPG